MEACCTCAKLLSAEQGAADSADTHRNPNSTSEKTATETATATATAPPGLDEKTPVLPDDRRLSCCARLICGKCLADNARFSSYCPYCQVSTGPSTLPDRLRDPPPYASYVSTAPPPPYHAAPPAYRDPDPDTDAKRSGLDEKNGEAEHAPDTLHFLDHEHDSVASLSLRYGVPASALRAANKLTSDHLLLARRAIVIPGEFYKRAVSLSPRPIGGEEEEARKGKIRRFMVTCKVADYEIAVLYLEQAGYDLDMALEAYFADEAWEREHPLEGNERRLGSVGSRPGRHGRGRGGYPVREMGGTRASQAAFLRRL